MSVESLFHDIRGREMHVHIELRSRVGGTFGTLKDMMFIF